MKDESAIIDTGIITGIRVLFAEDADENLEQFKRAVILLGWDGIYVNNAVEIIEAVNVVLSEGLVLDAVVANISFLTGPKVTSITAAREIRKALPNVPIIFISPYVTLMIREEVRKVEAELIQLPLDIGNLFTRLAQLIYWNRIVSSSKYEGQDRRRNSVNQTNQLRRDTDYILSIPDGIAETLKGLTRGM